MIEHVVIYDYEASSETELSLSVDERVWVCGTFMFHYFSSLMGNSIYVNCVGLIVMLMSFNHLSYLRFCYIYCNLFIIMHH